MNSAAPVTVVGGGIAGLITAIEVAERGGRAVVRERARHLGGRARTSTGARRTNFGPHALYADGPLWAWLQRRDLLPPTRAASPLTVRVVHGGTARRAPVPVLRAAALTLRDAPADVAYRDWVAGRVPADQVDAVCRVACFWSFAADPGALAARFVNERNARLVRPPSPARFVADGGWQAIVDRLERRARELGVELRLGDPVEALPPAPVVVATELDAASALLGERLEAPRADAVLLDLAVRSRRGMPSAVLDLDGGAFAERYTAFDRSLAPAGEELLQCHAGLHDGEPAEAAVARIEQALDRAIPGWRAGETWRAVRRSHGRSGAVELPSAPWQARPAIRRDDGVFLVGDAVAAPGLLAEVAVASAVQAATALIARAAMPAPAVRAAGAA